VQVQVQVQVGWGLTGDGRPDARTRGACTLIPAMAVRYSRPSLRAQLDHGENPRSARTFSAMRIC